ncbi:MAG: hypothetical protein LBI36_06640 [Oscillospiraceae bacterium]|jgi:hypothetical protein|nr:hypothetical protein [Oscillospiraceae bacterium]
MGKKNFSYKGYDLVRKDDEIYYGNMSGEYVSKIDVVSSREFKDIEVADKVKVQLLPTDTENFDLAKMKSATRDSLYEALEIAHTWLGKANE